MSKWARVVLNKDHPAFCLAAEVLCLCSAGSPNRGVGNSIKQIADDLRVKPQTVVRRLESTPLPQWCRGRMQQDEDTRPVFMDLVHIFHRALLPNEIGIGSRDGICLNRVYLSLAIEVCKCYWRLVYEEPLNVQCRECGKDFIWEKESPPPKVVFCSRCENYLPTPGGNDPPLGTSGVDSDPDAWRKACFAE